MNWSILIGNILAIIGLPMLIYIFWKVRKLDKENNLRRQEVIDLYSGKYQLRKKEVKNNGKT